MPSLFALTPYIAVAVLLMVLAAVAWRVDDWGRDWTTNHAELRADSPDPQLRPVRVAESPRKAADRLTAALDRRADWSTVDPAQAGDEISEADRPSNEKDPSDATSSSGEADSSDKTGFSDRDRSTGEHALPSGKTVRLHLTHRTSVFRFVDDVHVTIKPDGEGSLITASSRSRIGKGDLGQNPRNLRQLVSILRSELTPEASPIDPRQ